MVVLSFVGITVSSGISGSPHIPRKLTDRCLMRTMHKKMSGEVVSVLRRVLHLFVCCVSGAGLNSCIDTVVSCERAWAGTAVNVMS